MARLSIGLTKIPLTSRFGQLLVDHGLATKEQIDTALAVQKQYLATGGEHRRIGDLLQITCGINPDEMEQVFRNQLRKKIQNRLQNMLRQDPELGPVPGLRITITDITITAEDSDRLQGEADFQILSETSFAQTFLICLPFDYFFTEAITNMDFLDAMDQIRNGLAEPFAMSRAEQRSMGISLSSP